MRTPTFYDINGHTVYGVPYPACPATLSMNGGHIECDVAGEHTLHGAGFGFERINWTVI